MFGSHGKENERRARVRNASTGPVPDPGFADYLRRAAEKESAEIARTLPDLTLIGPESGAELRRMIYGA